MPKRKVQTSIKDFSESGEDSQLEKKKLKVNEITPKATRKAKLPAKVSLLEGEGQKANVEEKRLNKVNTDFSNIDFQCNKQSSSGKDWNLKISSWNVVSLRALVKKVGMDYVKRESPDIMCFQETKCKENSAPEEAKLKDYYRYFSAESGEDGQLEKKKLKVNEITPKATRKAKLPAICNLQFAISKGASTFRHEMTFHRVIVISGGKAGNKTGYAGVALYSKMKPLDVKYEIGSDYDDEGRVVIAEYEKFFLVNAYVPNAGRDLVTLPKRMDWDICFRSFLSKLNSKKPVVLCGDLNVAHHEIDLKNPSSNIRSAGFTQEERDGFTALLNEGFVDTFRKLYPDRTGAYTFWSYIGNARSRNVGWRLDYFVVSERLMPSVCDSVIRSDVYGSDHCPITLFLSV